MAYKSDYLVKLKVEKAWCSQQLGATKQLCANREKIIDLLLTADDPKSELERIIYETNKNLAECKYLLEKLDSLQAQG